MEIVVDAMGGNSAPVSSIRGALAVVRELGVEVILADQGEDTPKVLKGGSIGELPPGPEIVHVSEVVEIYDSLVTAFKERRDFSLTVGLNPLKNRDGAAFVPASSAGTLLPVVTLMVKRIWGIHRTAMAPAVPIGGGGAMFTDCSAMVEDTPEYLLQLVFMGSYYVGRVFKRPEPKVGLLNIDAELSRGTNLQRRAYVLLTEAGKTGRTHFADNVEVREVMYGEVDAAVSDGYSGGIFLKVMEDTGGSMAKQLKVMPEKNLLIRLTAVLVLGDLRDFKRMMDSNEVDGTSPIGIPKPIVKAHGSSDNFVIKNAIRQAQSFVASGIIEDITENIDHVRLCSG